MLVWAEPCSVQHCCVHYPQLDFLLDPQPGEFWNQPGREGTPGSHPELGEGTESIPGDTESLGMLRKVPGSLAQGVCEHWHKLALSAHKTSLWAPGMGFLVCLLVEGFGLSADKLPGVRGAGYRN